MRGSGQYSGKEVITMARVYLSGPISEGQDPHAWRRRVQNTNTSVDWINPFKLHDIPKGEERDRVQEIIDVVFSELLNCDAVLLRRIENYNLTGASMEAREAYTHAVPVVVWNTAETEIPLFLEGHATEVHADFDTAVDRAVTIASD